MTDRDYFQGFQPESHRQEPLDATAKRPWKIRRTTWPALQKGAISPVQEFPRGIVRARMTYMDGDPGAPEVQELVARLHRWLNNYYDCDLERLLGVIRTYGEKT